ncbi:MAG: hypothetical protein ACTSU0_05105, partial [Alphaproteobacteria bacterium]
MRLGVERLMAACRDPVAVSGDASEQSSQSLLVQPPSAFGHRCAANQYFRLITNAFRTCIH